MLATQIQSIRDRQKEERRLLTNKRVRDRQYLEREIEHIKRVKLSIVNSASEECTLPVHNHIATLCFDNILTCFEYLDIASVWNVRSVCKCFYNAYTMCNSSMMFHTLNEESIRANTLLLAHYAIDTPSFNDKEQAGNILTYVYKNYPSVKRFRDSGKNSLSLNRMNSLIKRCAPLYHHFKDRIIIDTLHIHTSKMRYHSTVDTFLNHVFDISYIQGGIIIEASHRYTFDTDRIIGALLDAKHITWFRFSCTSQGMSSLLSILSSVGIVLTNIRNIILPNVNERINIESVREHFPNLLGITYTGE